ncbi:hypothetical protein DFH06DRAFT_1148038 [Mycena polygramma]|nr:hypothetical protein DFH06DRAFT_1148038 [Mycena polygramma]
MLGFVQRMRPPVYTPEAVTVEKSNFYESIGTLANTRYGENPTVQFTVDASAITYIEQMRRRIVCSASHEAKDLLKLNDLPKIQWLPVIIYKNGGRFGPSSSLANEVVDTWRSPFRNIKRESHWRCPGSILSMQNDAATSSRTYEYDWLPRMATRSKKKPNPPPPAASLNREYISELRSIFPNTARRHVFLEASNLTKKEASARRMGPLRPPLLIQRRGPKRPFTACGRLLLRRRRIDSLDGDISVKASGFNGGCASGMHLASFACSHGKCGTKQDMPV